MSLLRRIEGPNSAAAETSITTSSERNLAAPGTTQLDGRLGQLKLRVQRELIQRLDPRLDTRDEVKVLENIRTLFDEILDSDGLILPRAEKQRMLDAISAEIIGFGPIQPLLLDPTVSEVMVNGPKKIYVEQKGRLTKTEVQFHDNDHVRQIIDRIISPLGRRCDESSPMVDARLPDGSRVNAIIPPLSLTGPTITIRKFSKTPLVIDDLIRFGSMTPTIAKFLQACVGGRMNVVVSGGTGSGKTTLLNVLSSFIPDDERIITVEDAAELQLRQDHVITLESRKANIEGKGAVTIRDLVANCLRMRPDRIVVGECRSGETLDMLQAMNTGHDGSLTTLHANNPRDAIARIETMCLMSGVELPQRAIREQIASAVNLIVQQSRLRDGSRKITYITEVIGMEGDAVAMQDIFVFEQTGFENGKVLGGLVATGVIPKFLERLRDEGMDVPDELFVRPDGTLTY
jgi:pilus assembly protein CpaF